MELTDYWKIFRAHWVSIIAITLAGSLIGFGWALLQPRVYTANASGIVAAGVSSDLGSALAGENYAKSRVKSYLDLATSRSVAERVIKSLGIDANPDALRTKVSVSNPLDTATLKVSASAATPEEARALAEAWVIAIGEQVKELENADVQVADPADPADPYQQGTQESIVSFRTMDAAQLPTAPSSPNTKLAIAIGTLAGLAIAIAYALLRRVFDRRVQSISEVERETEVSVLGTIPLHKGFDKDHRMISSAGGNDRSERGAEEYAVAESMRELRTNLQFMNIDNPPRKIVVTSALPGEGKSTVIANLANTIAAGGQRVVVIDGDLRRPMVAKAFGLLEGVGLTDVLIGRAKLTEVLQPWGQSGKLFVLGAGKIPPNPSELLASDTLHKLIDQLAEHAIVLIDAPPLLPVTDAAIITARTDGALIVTRARRATYDELKAALANLKKVSGHPLGIILNGVPSKGVKAEGYGYRYRSYYGRMETEAVPTDRDISGSFANLFDTTRGTQNDDEQAGPRRRTRQAQV